MLPPNRSTETSPTLIVQETARPPAPVLRYIDQVVGTPQPDIEFRFSQGVLTRFDVDVVHVAESNLDLLLGTRGATAPQRLLATLALARNLVRHRIALVRTLDDTHRRGPKRRVGRLARRALDRATAAFVVLDESTYTPDPTRTTMIPHPHYRDRFVGYPRGQQTAGRMLCVSPGNLPAEAQAFFALPRLTTTPGATLRLAGVARQSLEEPIRSALARHSATISARLERLSDAAQVQEIDDAELVLVPCVTSLHDLQLVFLALSLDRAVLTPHTEAMARLAEVVGPGWIHLSDGPITAEAVDDAFDSLRDPRRAEHPDLDGRDLATTHGAYAAVFRAATAAQST